MRPGALVLLVLLGVASSAEAQPEPRVAVDRFSGPQSGGLRVALISNLEENGLVVVTDDELRDAARELGLPQRLRSGDYPEVAAELGVAAFLDGRVVRRHRRWALTVSVRDGASGELLGSATWAGRTVASLRGVRRTGYDRLSEHIEGATPPEATARRTAGRRTTGRQTTGRQTTRQTTGRQTTRQTTGRQTTGRQTTRQTTGRQTTGRRTTGRDSDPDETEEIRRTQTASAVDGDVPWYEQNQPRRTSSRSGGDIDEDEDEQIDEDEDGDETVDEEGGDEASADGRHDALSVSLLVGTLRRAMETTALVAPCFRDPEQVESCDPGSDSPEMAPATMAEVREYTSAGLGHGEIGFEAQLYPGAFGDDQRVPWFGAVLSFRQSIFLTSSGTPCVGEGRCDPAADVIPVGSTERELYFGVRGRYRFGDERRAPALRADVGYGFFLFDLDTNDLALLDRSGIIPPMRYSYVHIGAGLSYGFVPTYLTVGANFGYRLGLGVGTDAQAIWGVSTTNSQGLVVGGEIRTEMPYIVEGLYASINIEWFRFRTTFRGQTSCADSPDCQTSELWEPWPHRGDDEAAVAGGIEDPVNDAYLRLGLAIGYALR